MDRLLDIGLSNMAVATALALIAATVRCFCRRPALVHSLWLLVLLKLVTPPLAPLPIAWRPTSAPPVIEPAPVTPRESLALPAAEPSRPSLAASEEPAPLPIGPEGEDLARPVPASELRDVVPPQAPAGTASEPDPRPAATPRRDLDWRSIVTGLWLAGIGLWLTVAGVRVVRFRRLLPHARSAPADLQREAEAIATRIGLAHCPPVRVVAGAVSPMLWSFAGPAQLLLPAGLLERLDAAQRATLLAHELAHLRRRDHWVRNLELIVTALYWWFPLVWWARRELHEAEEQCCDAWVVWALPDSARAYALAIVATLDFLSGADAVAPLAASGIGPVHSLRRRLTMIMRGSTPRALSLVGFLAVVSLGALALPWQPTQAQDEPPRKLQNGDERPDSRPRGDLDRAQREIAELHDQMRRLHDRMEATQARLREAQRQLGQAAGALPRNNRGAGEAPDLAPANGRGRPGNTPPAAPGALLPGMTPPMAGGGRAAPRDLDSRLRDIEWKLDALLRQMDDLRRDVRRGRPMPPPGLRPGSPGDVAPPPPPPIPDTPPALDRPVAPTPPPARR